MLGRKAPTSDRRSPRPAAPKRTFSYYSGTSNAGQASQAGTQVNKRQRRSMLAWLKLLPMVSAAVVLFVALLISLTLSSDPNVVISSVTDTSTPTLQSKSVYRQAIQDILGRSVMSKSKLTINTDSLEKEIQSTFPEFEAVSIKLPFVGRRPVIILEPAEPSLILSNNQNQAYVIDTSGRAIADATKLQQGLNLQHVSDQSNFDITLGAQALPNSTVNFITTFLYQLKKHHIKTGALSLPARASQLNVRLTGQKYYLKCNLEGDPMVQAGTFLALRRSAGLNRRAPQQYIDLRVSGRAYYK